MGRRHGASLRRSLPTALATLPAERSLLSALSRDELRALAEAAAAGQVLPPERLVTVPCPRGGAGSFAASVGASLTGQAARRAAWSRLDRECPDHAHVFPVD